MRYVLVATVFLGTACGQIGWSGEATGWRCQFFDNVNCTGTAQWVNAWTEECFNSAAQSFMCYGATTQYTKLVQSPSTTNNCYCQNNCVHFPDEAVDTATPCYNMEASGFSLNYTAYRWVQGMSAGVCTPNTCS